MTTQVRIFLFRKADQLGPIYRGGKTDGSPTDSLLTVIGNKIVIFITPSIQKICFHSYLLKRVSRFTTYSVLCQSIMNIITNGEICR